MSKIKATREVVQAIYNRHRAGEKINSLLAEFNLSSPVYYRKAQKFGIRKKRQR